MGTTPSSPSSRCTIAEPRSPVAVLSHSAINLDAEDPARTGEFQIVVRKTGGFQTLCAGLLKASLEDPQRLPKEKLKSVFTEVLGGAAMAPAEVDIAWNEFWIAHSAPVTDPFAAQLVSM